MAVPSVCIGYHYPCPDGAFAALAAWLRLHEQQVATAFIPLTVYASAAEKAGSAQLFVPGSVGYLLDFSGGPDFIKSVALRVSKLILIDHHKTAAEDLAAMEADGSRPANLEVVMDMKKSGCGLALAYFSSVDPLPCDSGLATPFSMDAAVARHALLQSADGLTPAAEVRQLFAYVEDNDIWVHALPRSKVFSTGLAAYDHEFDFSKNTQLPHELLSLCVERVLARGEAKTAENNAHIAADIARAFVVSVPVPGAAEARFLATLAEHPELRSELGHQLATLSAERGLRGIAAVVSPEPRAADAADKLKMSLRSLPEEDASAIARAHGGGGHKNAASFMVLADTFSGWRR